MDGIFGVGPLEILLVLVLALIFLGPQDMVKTARGLGRAFYRLYHSPIWRQIMSTQQELRDLPNKFVREAGLEETMADLKKDGAAIQADIRQVTQSARTELTAASQDIKAATTSATAELTAASHEIKGQPPVPALPAPPADSPAADPSPAPPSSPTQPDNFSI